MLLHLYRWPSDSNAAPTAAPAAQTLVFLHGMGGTGALWRPIAAALEDHHRILAPDQRGHGGSQSAGAAADYHPQAYGKDVIETLQAEGVKRAVLIGHSMGVRTACAAAELAPELVQGLLLIDLGLSGAAGGGLGEALERFLGSLPDSFPTRAEARAYLTAHCPDPSMGAYLAAVAVSAAGGGETRFPFLKEALLATLRGLKDFSVRDCALQSAQRGIPMLVLRGGESRVWSARDYALEKAIFAQYPQVRFETVEGAGHGLPFEKRLEFIARLEAWLKTL